MRQVCNYRTMLGFLAVVYPIHADFKTQGNSKSIYNESILMVCHFLRLALDTCGEFKRCYLKDHVEETIFTCINYWRAVNLSCSSGIKLLV